MILRTGVLIIGTAICAGLASTASAQADYHAGGMFNHCVQKFRDRWNWVSFRNNCPESVNIVFQDRPNYTGTSAVELRPGAEDSTGREQIGTMAVCRANYIPVDANNHYWKDGQFRCKKS